MEIIGKGKTGSDPESVSSDAAMEAESDAWWNSVEHEASKWSVAWAANQGFNAGYKAKIKMQNNTESGEVMTTEIHCFYEVAPMSGSRFVALYADMSGAHLFMRNADGSYKAADGDLMPPADYWFADAGYLHYIYLPDNFKLWFENERELIADALINLAQEIAELRASTATVIESLADKMIPQTSNDGINAIIQDAVESWAYTWFTDMIRGKAESVNSDDIKTALMSVPLESVLDEKLNAK